MSNTITNTATTPPSIRDLIPGGIEASERRGQRELVASTQLPAPRRDAYEVLTAAGVVFGEASAADLLFVQATLPAGWLKVPHPSHDMYSFIVDDKGRRRAEIFYKAAFYDRRAAIRPLKRFSCDRDYADPTVVVFQVRDGDEVVFRTAAVPNPASSENPTPEDWDRVDDVLVEAQAEALAWLVARYPQWEDPNACWD